MRYASKVASTHFYYRFYFIIMLIATDHFSIFCFSMYKLHLEINMSLVYSILPDHFQATQPCHHYHLIVIHICMCKCSEKCRLPYSSSQPYSVFVSNQKISTDNAMTRENTKKTIQCIYIYIYVEILVSMYILKIFLLYCPAIYSHIEINITHALLGVNTRT